MRKRKLRIVKKSPLPAIGVCERCNAQFKSSLPSPGTDIRAQFDAHTCKREDASQAAARIVREATEE